MLKWAQVFSLVLREPVKVEKKSAIIIKSNPKVRSLSHFFFYFDGLPYYHIICFMLLHCLATAVVMQMFDLQNEKGDTIIKY